MRMIFLHSAKGPGKESGSQAGGGGTQVYSLTFLSWVSAFVAVGTLAKCVVVFVSYHGRKCRGVWSSVTWLSSARNSKIWFRNVAVVENSLWGCCFVFIPILHMAHGIQRRKGERWGRTACRAPLTSRTENNVARVKAVLDRDRRLNVRLIAEEVGLPKTDGHRIIMEDLHMRKICVKLVPKNLSNVWEFLAQNNITTLPHPPYSPGLASYDSFYSPSSKPTSKDIILGQLKMSRQLRRGLWTTSQVKTSSTAMKSGSNVGIAVFDHKEPVLKGINCNCMYVQ